MLRLRIMDLLEERGKTRYWLYKQMGGMSYQNLLKMVNNQTKGIRFETIEVLCQVLECTPNDLFTMDLDQPEAKP